MTGIFGIESKFIAPMTTRPNAAPNNWSMGTPLSYGKRRATSQPSNPIVTNERANAASSDHRAGHGTYFVARKLPAGPARNDLRQLARGLFKLHRAGSRKNGQVVQQATTHVAPRS